MNQSSKTFTIGGQQTQVQTQTVMKRVYSMMFSAMLITAGCAWATVPFAERLISMPGLFIALWVVEIIFVVRISLRMYSLSLAQCTRSFYIYAALNGITLSPLLIFFTTQSVISVFFITAGTFGLLSLWARTTKRDLSSWRQYLVFGVIGIIIASITNIFIGSGPLELGISCLGVIVFMGLTAYDTKQLSKWAGQLEMSDASDMDKKLAVICALKLYLDFINMFIFLLRIFGRD